MSVPPASSRALQGYFDGATHTVRAEFKPGDRVELVWQRSFDEFASIPLSAGCSGRSGDPDVALSPFQLDPTIAAVLAQGPLHLQFSRVLPQSPIFPRVGGKFGERKSWGLRRIGGKIYGRPADLNALVSSVRLELRAHDVFELDRPVV